MPGAEDIDDIYADISDNEWFRPIAQSCANPSPLPAPSIEFPQEHKLQVSVQQFYWEENGLLWLHGYLERKQVENDELAKKHNAEEGVELTIIVDDEEKQAMAEMWEWVCIWKTMQWRILHGAHNSTTGGHCGAEWTC